MDNQYSKKGYVLKEGNEMLESFPRRKKSRGQYRNNVSPPLVPNRPIVMSCDSNFYDEPQFLNSWYSQDVCLPGYLSNEGIWKQLSDIPKSVSLVMSHPRLSSAICDYCRYYQNLQYGGVNGCKIIAAFCESCRIIIGKDRDNQCSGGLTPV